MWGTPALAQWGRASRCTQAAGSIPRSAHTPEATSKRINGWGSKPMFFSSPLPFLKKSINKNLKRKMWETK